MALDLLSYNGWLPSREVHDIFIIDLLERATCRYEARAEHVPSVRRFQQAIEANPTMVTLFKNVFLQSPMSQAQIFDFENLLHFLDIIVVEPPKLIQKNGISGHISLPMHLLFDILSNTSAAYDLFRMDEFNEALRDLLCSWGEYLKTSDSGKTLNDSPDGWFSEAGLKALEENRGEFNKTYVVFDDTAVNRGYISWDEFFTRRIQPGARPIVPVPPNRTVIYNPCESTVARYSSNVQAHDRFWLKGEMPYSLYDIFDGDNDTAQKFVGGTVYQSFLSPQDYHRWHSPVTGTVVDARVVPGTYYAFLPDEGRDGDPRGAFVRSLPWLTMVSARAIITIQADNDKIGLVAFIGIGMAEVSTCELLVQPGQRVEPGRQIGMFHFGGSAHALIFGPKAKVTFTDGAQKGKHVHVNKIIANVGE